MADVSHKDVIAAIVDQTACPRADVEHIITTMLAIICETLLRGEKVVLPGFGTFEARERRGKGKAGEVERRVGFKVSTTLNELVKGYGIWWPSEERATDSSPSEGAMKTIEERAPDTPFSEGAMKPITVNVYERSREAREACLAHYGFSCCVCDVDFEEYYGAIGAAYMHVHHGVPVSSIGAAYIVDPIRDLRPVCPNCHAMLHRREPPYSIEELQDMIDGQLDRA